MSIEEQIDNWVRYHLKSGFEFRKHQKEAIISIVTNIVETKENHTHIIEAPTGSGKSLIAIISAGVLSEYYGLSSYILCSDLYLWEQYANFLKSNPQLRDFGYVKGQTGNYLCEVNNEDMRNADCRMRGLSWATLFNADSAIKKGYECAISCQYVNERKKAVKSSVTLMTYQLFLYMINVVTKEEGGHNSFTNRPIIFCDECHNIPEIVQSKMTVTVKESDFDKWYDIYGYAQNCSTDLFESNNTKFELLRKYKSYDDLHSVLMNVFEQFSDDKSHTNLDIEAMNKYSNVIDLLGDVVGHIETYIQDKKDSLVKHDVELYKLASYYRNYCCHWHDFMDAIRNAAISDISVNDQIQLKYNQLEDRISSGIRKYFIKQISIDESKEEKPVSVSFNCIKEDYMIYRYLLSQADWKVLFSATVGGKDAFEENMGIKYTLDKTSKFEVIPSTFNFEKSPVLFLNRYKMSFKEKERSLENLIPIVIKTLEKHSEERGIIQTGTYDIAQQILFYAPKEVQDRLILYRGSKEKTAAIAKYKASHNGVLIGPTLCEGIDLPNDYCRFIVIMKMPYPNMKDKLVSAKMKLFPLWYNSVTSNAIIQGIGRGIRNDNDYCKTYIYDACFYSLYINTKEQYSKELQKRIKVYG